jgi:hypothetical protein
VIGDLLDDEISIEVVNAPVILTEENRAISMVVRRLNAGEKLTVPEDCVKIFLYNWLTMYDMFTETNPQLIRLAFSDSLVSAGSGCRV